MKIRAKMSEFRNAIREAIKQITQDGVSQSKRAAHGYGNEEPCDRDVPGEGLPLKGLGEVEKEIGMEQGDDQEEEGEEEEETEEEEEEVDEEGITQTKRTNQGYGLEGKEDYNDYKDQPGAGLKMKEALGIEFGPQDNKKRFKKVEGNLICLPSLREVSPPSAEAERFITANKEDFKKRYGSDWERILYSTAWEKFRNKK